MELNKKFINISFDSDLDNIDHHYIESVLVIGGAGTIGSNYIKQLFEFNPSKIIVVDDKYALVGSYNWLSNNKAKNEERSLKTYDKGVIIDINKSIRDMANSE